MTHLVATALIWLGVALVVVLAVAYAAIGWRR